MNNVKEPTMAELYSHPELNVKKKRKWGWILISFFFFGLISNVGEMNTNGSQSITLILYLISAITAPIFYYWLKSKVKISKNIYLQNLFTGIIVIIIFSLVSAILGSVSYAFIYQYM